MELVGHIGVDAGLVWIGDPCYIIHAEEKPEVLGTNWSEFCGKPFETEKNGVTNFNYGHGSEGLGVAVSTLWGDGFYPVFVERETSGPRKGGIRRVIIDFDFSDDEESDEEA